MKKVLFLTLFSLSLYSYSQEKIVYNPLLPFGLDKTVDADAVVDTSVFNIGSLIEQVNPDSVLVKNDGEVQYTAPATGTSLSTASLIDSLVAGGIIDTVVGDDGLNAIFDPAAGSLNLVGDDAVTLTTTGVTGITLPTSGTVFSTADTTSGTPGDIVTQSQLAAIGGVTIGAVRDTAIVVADSVVNALLNGGTELGGVAPLLVDTITYFVFGYGTGTATDTLACAANNDIGSYFTSGSDTIVNIKFKGVVKTGVGTPTVGVRFYYDVNLWDGTPTAICAETNIVSTTSGTEITSFTNKKIPPGVWVWGEIETVSVKNKPIALRINQEIYKISTY